jgi:hypothetical protein
MPVATITNSTYQGNNTLSGLANALNTVLTTNCGFTFIKIFTSGTETFRTYSVNHDSTTYGTTFMQVITDSINLTSIYIRFLSGFNSSTNAMSDPGSYKSFSSTLNSIYEFKAINHPEIRGVIITQNTNVLFVGYYRPAGIPNWFSTNNYPYGFYSLSENVAIPNASLSITTGLILNDLGGASFNISPNIGILNNNPENNNRRYLLKSPLLGYTSSNRYIIGQFSTDIALVAAKNNSKYSKYNDTSTGHIYTGLEDPEDSINKGYILAIRTT